MSATETTAPLIGTFKSVSQNSPRVARTETRVQAESVDEDKKIAETLEVIDKEISEGSSSDRTPSQIAESYEEGLASVGLTLERARAIMEAVLVDNHYQETRYIRSLPVVLRTRTYHDTIRLHRLLSAENPVYQASIQDFIARYNLVGSLAKYGDREFQFPEDEKAAETAFNERMNFVETRNELVVRKLMALSYDFDNMLSKVFADGAPQDF